MPTNDHQKTQSRHKNTSISKKHSIITFSLLLTFQIFNLTKMFLSTVLHHKTQSNANRHATCIRLNLNQEVDRHFFTLTKIIQAKSNNVHKLDCRIIYLCLVYSHRYFILSPPIKSTVKPVMTYLPYQRTNT